jgi:hypothetical protein
MLVNLIVLAITVLMGVLAVVWLCCPRVRPWMEAPKYRVLAWDTRFPRVEHALAPPEEEAGQKRACAE